MIKIMLICNGKFTKQKSIQQAFLPGKERTVYDFTKNLSKIIKRNRKPHWGSETIRFIKLTKNKWSYQRTVSDPENGYELYPHCLS